MRGGAYGFTLDSIEKLCSMKSNIGNRTLILFVIESIEKKYDAQGKGEFVDMNMNL